LLDSRLAAAAGARGSFIPSFLLRTFIRLASRSIAMQKRYGVIGVTSIGMFGSGALWPLPLTSATVTAAIGTIVPRVVLAGGRVEQREHLCVTLSFDHDLIDGAAAARFSSRFAEVMSGAEPLRGELEIR
jgi:pyruvate/2-oxoglutarate dehydrogenase complex dihydrolipoamide acyltransferase (E2) component